MYVRISKNVNFFVFLLCLEILQRDTINPFNIKVSLVNEYNVLQKLNYKQKNSMR